MNALLPLLFCLAVPLLFALAKYMKDLDARLAVWLFGSVATGAVAGAVFIAVARDARPLLRVPLIALLISLAAIWLFRKEHAPDAFEGLLRGGLLASGFGVLLTLESSRPFGPIAVVLVSGLAAGAVASWMSDSASWPGKFGLVLASAAIAAAAASSAVDAVDPAVIASIAALAGALSAAASPFLLFPGVTEELEQESELGILPRAMVPRISHPLRRMSSAGFEPEAHRRIVQLAWRLALRRRRQRSMGLEESRLHQLEILKLRQELSELLRASDEITRASELKAPRIQSSPKDSPTE